MALLLCSFSFRLGFLPFAFVAHFFSGVFVPRRRDGGGKKLGRRRNLVVGGVWRQVWGGGAGIERQYHAADAARVGEEGKGNGDS